MKHYIVATIKPWNITAYQKILPQLPGKWFLFTDHNQLSLEKVQEIQPQYIFFPHWNWKVPESILDYADCVCFHATDLPYGRGGSPIQNLIAAGHTKTQVTALKMTHEFDAGPIYLKRPLSLAGNAEQIFKRLSTIVFKMIKEIVYAEPQPVVQQGVVTIFKRRTPAQSQLPPEGTLEQLYDHVRMLDAPTYPKGFIQYGSFRIEFTNAQLKAGTLQANVLITEEKKHEG